MSERSAAVKRILATATRGVAAFGRGLKGISKSKSVEIVVLRDDLV